MEAALPWTRVRIAPPLRVHGTSAAKLAHAKVKIVVVIHIRDILTWNLVYTCALGYKHSRDGRSCIKL